MNLNGINKAQDVQAEYTTKIVKKGNNNIDTKNSPEVIKANRYEGKVFVNYYKDDFKDLKNMSKTDIEDKVGKILSSITKDDVVNMMKSGISPNKLELQQLTHDISALKEFEREPVDENKDGYDQLGNKYKEGKTGSELNAVGAIIDELIKQGLPVNDENMSKAINSIDAVSTINSLSNSAINYLLKNDFSTTAENIYKAEHIGDISASTKMSEAEWQKLTPQVNEVIELAGMAIDEDSQGIAKDLLENDIPLTKENMIKANELKQFRPTENLQKLVERVVEGIKKQSEAIELTASAVEIECNNAVSVLEQAQPIDLQALLAQQKQITITSIKKQLQGGVNATSSYISDEALQAQRAVDTIRLKLNLETAQRLNAKGININMEEINHLLARINELDDATAVKDGVTNEEISLLKDTVDKTEQIKQMPLYTLGRAVITTEGMTLNLIHKTGSELQTKLNLENARNSYDTMMTEVRTDLGDSLKKAFNGINDMLKELQLEQSELNIKAVRILAYNQMEITNESIFNMKDTYQTVTNVLSSLTPSVATVMIRNQINPLTMDINELNSTIQQIKDEYGLTEDEKISKFIYEAEKSGEISAEEKKNLIGLYRLIKNVDKYDGKAIGLLVNTGQEINLKNLLAAVRLGQNKSMDMKLGQETGELEDIRYINETIMQQLESAFSSEMPKEKQTEASYEGKILNNILSNISPNKLMKIAKNYDILNTSLEQINQLMNMTDEEISNEYVKQQYESLQKISEIDASAYKLFEEYGLEQNVKSMLAADIVFGGNNNIYKEIKEKIKKLNLSEEKIDELISQFGNEIDTADDIEERIEGIEDLVNDVMNTQLTEGATSEELDATIEVKSVLKVLKDLSKQEYFQIPFEINGNIEQMNIHLKKGNQSFQTIEAEVTTEQLGKTEIKLVIENNSANIQVYGSQTGIKALQDNKDSLQEQLEAIEININSIEFRINSNRNTNFEITI